MAVDLNLLPVFLAVAEQGSFTGAATRLGMPSSNVSRAIRQLETQTGCRLIERTTAAYALDGTGAATVSVRRKNGLHAAGNFSQIRNDNVLTGCFRLTVPVKAAEKCWRRYWPVLPHCIRICRSGVTPADSGGYYQ